MRIEAEALQEDTLVTQGAIAVSQGAVAVIQGTIAVTRATIAVTQRAVVVTQDAVAVTQDIIATTALLMIYYFKREERLSIFFRSWSLLMSTKSMDMEC